MGTTGQIEDLTPPHFDSSVLRPIIDVQVDYLDGGAWTIAGTSDRLPRMAELWRPTIGSPAVVAVVRLYEGDDVDLVRRAVLRTGARMVRPGSPGSQIAPRLLPDPELALDSGHCSPGAAEGGDTEVVMWKLCGVPSIVPPHRPSTPGRVVPIRWCWPGWVPEPPSDLRRQRTG